MCEIKLLRKGFTFSLPFLSADCGITIEDNYIKSIYKHCINIEYPTMAIIGFTFAAAITQMTDIQVFIHSLKNFYRRLCILLFF